MVYLNRITADKMILLDDDDDNYCMVEVKLELPLTKKAM